MPKYIYKCSSTWIVMFQDETEFDTTDQQKWEELRSEFQGFKFREDFEVKFPIKAPSDPKVWLELFNLYDYHYGDVGESSEGNWHNESRKYLGELLDKDGSVISTIETG